MERIAIYAGSFDPPTLGHQDLARRALRICDTLIIAIGRNSAKKALFTFDEKLDMLRHLFRPYSQIVVESFEGMLVNYCRARRAETIIRGLRAVTDFEYELGIAHINAEQAGEDHGIPKVDTVFLPTNPKYSFVSSSSVRELASHGAGLQSYVDPYVEAKLHEKFNIT